MLLYLICFSYFVCFVVTPIGALALLPGSAGGGGKGMDYI